MGIQRKNKAFLGLMVSSVVLGMIPSAAYAFGPSKPTPPPPPSYSLPNPLRYVIVRPFVGAAAIQSPNQVTTTMSNVQQALDSDLETVVAGANTHLSYSTGGDLNTLDPCGTHLEIKPSVLAFEMNDLTANIQFGFNNTGTINVGQPTATASDTIAIGSIQISFELDECSNSDPGNCQSLLSTAANNTVVGNNFTFNVTWSELGANGSILSVSDLNNALLAIIGSGISQMTGSSAMAQVPWSAEVAAVDSNTGAITFLGGSQSDIGLNQYFTVYAQSASSSQCGVYQALACIHTTEVDGPSSVASVYKTLAAGQSMKVEPGDVVQVGSTSCAP